jgi:hypothetical protein
MQNEFLPNKNCINKIIYSYNYFGKSKAFSEIENQFQMLKVFCKKCNIGIIQNSNGSIEQYNGTRTFCKNNAIDISDSHDIIMNIIDDPDCSDNIESDQLDQSDQSDKSDQPADLHSNTSDQSQDNSTKDQIQQDSIERARTIIRLGLLDEYLTNVRNIAKRSTTTWSPVNAHALLRYPNLLLPVLSEGSISKLASVNYNWLDYADCIVKIAIRIASTESMLRVLDLVEVHYQIDYKSIPINFMLESNGDNMISGQRLFDKIIPLLNAGFSFTNTPVLSKELVICAVMDNFIDDLIACGLKLPSNFTIKLEQMNAAIQNNKIDKLVECGLNIKSSVYSWHDTNITLNKISIFLKAFPEFADDIFKILIDYVGCTLEYIVTNYNVDAEKVIKEFAK